MSIVRIINNSDKQLEELILKKLMLFNEKFIGQHIENYSYKKEEKNFYAVLDEKIAGGVIGYKQFDWYYISRFYVEEDYRGQAIGTKLIQEVEDYAQENNCIGIKLGTWDFQALGFYQKHGYELYGTLEDYPIGHTLYELKKKF